MVLPPVDEVKFTKDFPTGLKIVVTGAGGFIASHLAKRLKAEVLAALEPAMDRPGLWDCLGSANITRCCARPGSPIAALGTGREALTLPLTCRATQHGQCNGGPVVQCETLPLTRRATLSALWTGRRMSTWPRMSSATSS